MIKKIFLLLIILVITYIVALFLAPWYVIWISKILWLENFNKQVKIIKTDINNATVKIPNVDEITKKINNTVHTVKDGIIKTKNTIDDVRVTLSWAENTYNKTKETLNETLNTIEKFKENFNVINEVSEKNTQ